MTNPVLNPGEWGIQGREPAHQPRNDAIVAFLLFLVQAGGESGERLAAGFRSHGPIKINAATARSSTASCSRTRASGSSLLRRQNTLGKQPASGGHPP